MPGLDDEKTPGTQVSPRLREDPANTVEAILAARQREPRLGAILRR